MPIIKSARKRMRQETVRHKRNLVTKSKVKQARKELAAAKTSGDKAKIEKAARAYQSALDTAVKKNLMHRNKAARLLSNALKDAPAPKQAPATKKPAKKTVAKKATAKKTATKKPAAKKPAAKKASTKKSS